MSSSASYQHSLQPMPELRRPGVPKSRRAVRLAPLLVLHALAASSCRDLVADTGYCPTCNKDAEVAVPATATQANTSAGAVDALVPTTAAANSGSGTASNISGGSAGIASASPMPAPTSPIERDAAVGSQSSASRDAGSALGRDAATAFPQRDAAVMHDAGLAHDAGAKPEPDVDPPNPCRTTCPSDRPLCDAVSGICLACTLTDKGACTGNKTVCDVTNNRCVECSTNDMSACEPSGVCDVAYNRCVACTPTNIQRCPAGQQHCTQDSQCVECLETTDCASQARPHCSAARACEGCQSDADCVRFAGVTRCDAASQRCVACTSNEHCANGQCDLSMHMCQPPHSGATHSCEACSTDTQCAEHAFCVPWKDRTVCLPEASGGNCTGVRVYRQLQNTMSHANTAVYVCTPAPEHTCQAITDLVASRACSSQRAGMGSCGASDSICSAAMSSQGVCSYACSDDQDCPDSFKCQADPGAPVKVCGLAH